MTGVRAKSLTDAQRYSLQQMAKGYGLATWGSSHTNSTGSALERRGLATYAYDRTKGYTWGRWYITDAGRAALTPATEEQK